MKFKILLLNNTHDRETTGFVSATDYVEAVVNACHDSLGDSAADRTESWSEYVTHLVYLRGCEIPVDVADLKKRGIECRSVLPAGSGLEGMVYDPNVLERVLSGIVKGMGLQRRATVQDFPVRLS